ncbi:MAG: chorismate synthase [Chloroflexi bacterium]|nr:chorismate synthase [Chloroflexota bacterium]
MPLRFLTAGESHGPELNAILEGLPAGLRLDREALDRAMARRQAGFGSGGRMKIERDRLRISAGVMAGRSTGGPIALSIANRDHASWRDRDIEPMTIPRPGHADLSASLKYGYGDLRLALERASARETAARVAVGAICAQLLAAFGIELGCYVVAIGAVRAELPPAGAAEDYRARFAAAEADALRCPVPEAAAAMRAAVSEAARARDTLGGVFEVVALGLPPGLGSHVHWDRRLSGRLLGALGSIQAIKGVELGPAFENAGLRGSQVHDRLHLGRDGRQIERDGNRGGGLEGGITTGAPLLLRAAMKPISTTLQPLASVDLASGEAAETRYERSDICAVPRAAVVGEAMAAFVLADALLEKLGGDSLDELRPRFEQLRRGRLGELRMDDRPWRFGYDRPDADTEAT